jgi:O-methyltransferase domain
MHSTRSVDQEDHDDVYRLIMAGWGSQVIRTLAALSIAEHLDRGALTARQIAERACSDNDMTYRILRAGVALGFLEYDAENATFSGTPRLEILHPDCVLTLKHYAQTAGGPAFWLPAMRMPETVTRGSNHVEEMLGGDVWDFFAGEEAEARTFREAMSDISTPLIREAVAVIGDLGGEFAVDVGGANGAFVGELLRCNTHLSGAVLDLPQAMAGVAETTRRLDLSERMTGIDGDFFHSVPRADRYLLKFILHDWSDDSCVKILSNIRRSMAPGARLFIVEMVIADPADPGTSLSAVLMDMVMLHAFTGQERDLVQFERLLDAADLVITTTTPLHRPYQLIEARAR